MEDIGFWLVIAYLFLAPWAVRALRAPDKLAWPVAANVANDVENSN